MSIYCINEELINQLKDEEFKVLGLKPEVKRNYVFIYTPNNNLLFIYQDIFGYHISLQYKPCKANGSGCSTKEYWDSCKTIEDIKNAEIECNVFASTFKEKITKYKNFDEWYNSYYDKNNLVEL